MLLYLVNDTLDYYQIKSNKFKKRMAAFRVDEVIQNCLNLVSIQMEQKGLGLIVNIDPELQNIELKSDK